MDLKFDKMTVNTTLAQIYLKCATKSSDLRQVPTDYRSRNVPMVDIRDKLLTLATILKGNMKLIAQLEYLQRKIPMEDVFTQIDLIIQQIHYCAQQVLTKSLNTSNLNWRWIKFTKDMPLLLLGAIPRELVNTQLCYITPDKETETICNFIIKQCQDVGLEVYSQFRDPNIVVNWPVVNMSIGAVGVVSELSDIDSAVDVFLTSSAQAPWRLLRILVQESVYKQFKNALNWKCNLNKREGANIGDMSNNVIEYNGRVFLMDMEGSTESHSSSVAVEAYRTKKELKSLLNVYRPHYLSLWANDIAEINEITHTVNSPVVWVNNFADFRGPVKVSEAIYSHMITKLTVGGVIVKEISELQKPWLALGFETRRHFLCNALDKYSTDVPETEKKKCLEIKNELLKIEAGASGTFVETGSDYVCIGQSISNKIYFNKVNRNIITTEFFKLILLGNAFIIRVQFSNDMKRILDIFKASQIPVIYFPGDFSEGDVDIYYDNVLNASLFDLIQTTKVVWTNSGTIFAN